VPLLAIGLPTNATAAIMLSALQGWGFEPGPLLIEKQPVLVWTLIASLFVGNTMLLALNLPLAPLWAKLLQIPRPYLYAGILFFASMGAWAVSGEPFSLYVLLAIGLLGFAVRRFGMPVLPLIIGVILAPIAELHLRRSLQLSHGEVGGLIGGPVSWFCYVVMVIAILWPLIAKLVRMVRGGDGGPGAGGTGAAEPSQISTEATA
jgi:putative tricarboxylic transport membrane protein